MYAGHSAQVLDIMPKLLDIMYKCFGHFVCVLDILHEFWNSYPCFGHSAMFWKFLASFGHSTYDLENLDEFWSKIDFFLIHQF